MSDSRPAKPGPKPAMNPDKHRGSSHTVLVPVQYEPRARKRLFIGLAVGTSVLLCLLLLLGWAVPVIGFERMHPALPYLTGFLLLFAIAAIAFATLCLVVHVYTGKPFLWSHKFRGMSVRFFLPVMELVGRLGGISPEEVRHSFIKVNNELIHTDSLRYEPGQILILLPHCLQRASCEIRLNNDVNLCRRCGACPMGGLLELRDRYGVHLAVAAGGTVARRIVVQKKPRFILAVACERDLSSGIQDTFPLPVFGLLNERPHGPCYDTLVSLPLVESALKRFIKPECLPGDNQQRGSAPLETPPGDRAPWTPITGSKGPRPLAGVQRAAPSGRRRHDNMISSTQRGAKNRSGHDPRAAALFVLDRVLTGQEAAQAVLDAALRESKMVPSDKGLATELVYGYLRAAIRLNWELERLLKNPAKLPPEMRLTLGLAAYELAYLNRVPNYASVNWAVTRVRNRFGQGLAGVANGTLRAFARSLGRTYNDPERLASIADPLERLALGHSLPVWIARLWEKDYGPETALTYMRASSGQALPAVRINAAKEDATDLRASIIAEGKGVVVGAWGVAFPSGAPYRVKPLEKEGKLSFQSAGVQEVLTALGADTWPGPVWDACAGRGGKTAALLEAGVAVRAASDLSTQRLQGLLPELQRLGLGASGVSVLQADATNPPESTVLDGPFATILADVPCTGLGTLARRPEIRFRRTEDDIAALIRIQDAILDAAVPRLAPGGAIIYLTCTLNRAENQERAAAFLARHAGFGLEREYATPPDAPWNEFFYAAVLRRR